MKKRIAVVGVALGFVLSSRLGAQTPTAVASSTILPAPQDTHSISVKYPRRRLYQARSVWGELRIVVVERRGRFELQVDSNTPLDEWHLLSPDGVVTMAKGTARQGFQIKTSVPVGYVEGLQLRIMAHSEGEPKPISVRLSERNAPTGKGLLAQDPAWIFIEDPGRPYNKLVRDFYQSAVAHRRKGETREALRDLDQARRLDGSHPQVAALREKLLGEDSEAEVAERVRDARRQMENGNPEIALERLGLILREYPDCRSALTLRGQIEERLKDKTKRRFVKKRVRPEAAPVTVGSGVERAPGTRMEDRKALADKAYNLGLESYRRGHWVEARKFWEEVLRYVPGHSQARRNLDRLQSEHQGVSRDN